MELLIAFIFISLLIGLMILSIKTSITPKVTNTKSNLDNIDDCGSSQYITYMKQFTPEQHQAEMDREVEEIWEEYTWADLND